MNFAAQTWLVFDSGPLSPPLNMAWDEALLLSSAELGSPVLRFYSWNEPAATFGYFQKFSEIESWTTLRPLIRRPTGGGLVPHAADWTYSLTFPPTHEWFSLQAEESYLRLHEWIRDAFALAGLPVVLSPHSDKQMPGRCFAGPEKFDLVTSSGKIAGAAQRRNQMGMLIQGSIQPLPAGVTREAWQHSMLKSAEARWGLTWRPLVPAAPLIDQASSLAVEKYASDSFNRRR